MVTPVTVAQVATPVTVAPATVAPVIIEPVKTATIAPAEKYQGPYGPHSKSLHCSSYGFFNPDSGVRIWYRRYKIHDLQMKKNPHLDAKRAFGQYQEVNGSAVLVKQPTNTIVLNVITLLLPHSEGFIIFI